MTGAPIRVLLAGDHVVVREGLRPVLGSAHGVEGGGGGGARGGGVARAARAPAGVGPG